MKIDRLIGIITLLLQRGQITAPALAERFEVSRRTILRDLEEIDKAGIPIVTTQGYGGGISLAPGYSIDKTLFTREELQSILTGLGGLDSVSQAPHRANLLDKLGENGNQVMVEESMLIDLASHDQAALSQKIAVIKRAIEERRQILFQYYYTKGESLRRIEPYYLVFQWSAWYVFGYCLDRGGFRLFKLHRLWQLRLSEDTFSAREIPAGALDFNDYFTSRTIRLKAVFHPSQRYRLIEEYGVDSYTVQPDGGLLLERAFASYGHMREWIFSFGDQVQILAPADLQADRKRQAANILQLGEPREGDG